MKLNKEMIEKIIFHESLFRPRATYAKLLEIDPDTITNGINRGKKLYEENTGLFQIPKDLNEFDESDHLSNDECLIFLYRSILQFQIISELKSHDFALTGDKKGLRSYLIKKGIRENDMTLETVASQVLDGSDQGKATSSRILLPRETLNENE